MVAVIAASCGAHIRAANAGAASATRSAASKLVRFETGSSRLAVLASQIVVMANGRAAIRALGARASITGVSSTAVVSRLRNIVVSEAKATQSKNSAA